MGGTSSKSTIVPPVSATPLSATPLSATPLSATPLSATPLSVEKEKEIINSSGIALAANGDIYITDSNRIKKVTSKGIISTFAGNYSQDIINGKGSLASFRNPKHIVFDSKGNIFVSELNCIRKITPDGNVSTFAGNNSTVPIDGKGTEASFALIHDLVIDNSDNLFVLERSGMDYTIRKITPDGVVSKFVDSAMLFEAQSIAYNKITNTLYVSGGILTEYYIREINSEREISELAHIDFIIYNMIVDSKGTIFGVNEYQNYIYYITIVYYPPYGDEEEDKFSITKTGKFTMKTCNINIIAGNSKGYRGSCGSKDGDATNAEFCSIRDIAIDATGVVYVIDNFMSASSYDSKIRKILDGQVSTIELMSEAIPNIGSASGTRPLLQLGGYKEKYLKYKQKYIALKNKNI